MKLTVNPAQFIWFIAGQTHVNAHEQHILAIETEVFLLKFD